MFEGSRIRWCESAIEEVTLTSPMKQHQQLVSELCIGRNKTDYAGICCFKSSCEIWVHIWSFFSFSAFLFLMRVLVLESASDKNGDLTWYEGLVVGTIPDSKLFEVI